MRTIRTTVVGMVLVLGLLAGTTGTASAADNSGGGSDPRTPCERMLDTLEDLSVAISRLSSIPGTNNVVIVLWLFYRDGMYAYIQACGSPDRAVELPPEGLGSALPVGVESDIDAFADLLGPELEAELRAFIARVYSPVAGNRPIADVSVIANMEMSQTPKVGVR